MVRSRLSAIRMFRGKSIITSAKSPICTFTRPPLRCWSCALRLCVQNSRSAPCGFRTPPPSQSSGSLSKNFFSWQRCYTATWEQRTFAPFGMCVPSYRAKGETPCRPSRPSPSSEPSATHPPAAPHTSQIVLRSPGDARLRTLTLVPGSAPPCRVRCSVLCIPSRSNGIRDAPLERGRRRRPKAPATTTWL